MIREELAARLSTLARTPLLLVACDYDGTLAGFTVLRDQAEPNAGSLRSLRSLAMTPWTTGAVVSGRSMEDLSRLLGPAGPELRVGSHGAEWLASGAVLDPARRDLLGRVVLRLTPVARMGEGLSLEVKPASACLHYRGACSDLAAAAAAAAVERCSPLPGVRVQHGSAVVEFMVTDADKGEAIRRLKYSCGATGVLFLGDDVTDEDAFRALEAGDVSIKVGAGATAASHRVGTVEEVAGVLDLLATLRRRWVGERELTPLSGCGLLSDQRTAAVVSPGARISWLCLPRLDSAAIFAELVGGASAGCFEIGPADGGTPVRCGYDGDSFVLTTEWAGLRVSDYLDCSAGRAFQKAGRTDLIRVIEGASPARVRFAPRLDFGRIATHLRAIDGGIEVQGSNDPIVLRSPGVSWSISQDGVHHTAEARVEPALGAVVLELRYGSANPRAASEDEPTRRDQNRRFWSGWAGSLKLPSVRPDLVKRSALVLKSLCYGPSGGIAAAATTGLPEQVGGVRNWDYRFCWPRDAAKAAASLVRLGNTGHAIKFLDWMLDVVDRCESPERLHPIYTLTGSHLPPEADLGHLQGYGQSRPVRVGNAAANQVQLDVFGPIVDLVAMLAERGAPVAPDHWRLVRSMVRAVEARWAEPDHGIWEMRLERRHHVHSKAMCWHTINRALAVEEALCGERNPDWTATRDAIRAELLCRGWSESARTFVGTYDHDYLDAAVLEIGLTGLLEPQDPRWSATVDAVERELRDGPTVRRYKMDDGLPGDEGGMHLCTGWLIESLLTVGRADDAVALFEQFAGLVGDLGTLTEQYDPRRRQAVGNLGQAYSHLALINAAAAIDRHRRGGSGAAS